jgi:cell division protein FtsQ
VAFKPKRGLGRIVLVPTAASVSLLIAFVLVAAFSPLLAIEKIQVSGNQRIPTKLLTSALSNQLGKPLPQASLEGVSNDLKNFTLIQSVSVVNLPPHTLEVRIIERQPICIIESASGAFLYDPAGVRIASATSSDVFPVVQAAGKPGASPEFGVAIKALLALPVSLFPRVATVAAPSMDSVSFKLRGLAGQKVIWGDTSQAELKARVLLALMKHQKRTDRITYDVSSPKAPTVRY